MIQCIQIHQNTLFAGCEGGQIHVRSLDDLTNENVTVLEGHTNSVMCMRGRDGVFASCAMDQDLRIWDTSTLQCKRHIAKAHDRSLHSLCLHNAEETLFTGSRDHTIKMWDMRCAESVAQLHGHEGSVTCLGIDDRRIVSGGGFNRGPGDVEVLSTDSTLRMWDIRKLSQVWSYPINSVYHDHPLAQPVAVQNEPVLCTQLLQGRILSGHGDGTIRLFDFAAPPVAAASPSTRGG